MTLPSSGIITIGDIRTEFGDSGITALSDYYGEGSPALPSSGILLMSDFHGVSDEIIDSTTVTCGNHFVAGGKEIPDTFYRGFDNPPNFVASIGSIANSIFRAAIIETVASITSFGTVQYVYLSGNRAQDYFNTAVIDGDTHLSSSATYAYDSGKNATWWYWTGAQLPGTGTIDFDLTY